MKIPKMFFGTGSEVKQRVLPLVKRLKKGEHVQDFDFGEFMDSDDIREPGKIWGHSPEGYPHIMLEEYRTFSKGPPVYHLHALLYRMQIATPFGSITAAKEKEVIDWSLAEPWRFLPLEATAGTLAMADFDRRRTIGEPEDVVRADELEWCKEYLQAARRFWPIFHDLGQRFSADGATSRMLHEGVTTTLRALAACGVDVRASVKTGAAYARGYVEEQIEKVLGSSD